MKKSKNISNVLFVFIILTRLYLALTTSITFLSFGLLSDVFFIMIFTVIMSCIPYKFVQKFIALFLVLFVTLLSITNEIYFQYFKTLVKKVNLQGLTFMSSDLMTKDYSISLTFYSLAYAIIGIVMIVLIIKQTQKDYEPWINKGKVLIPFIFFTGLFFTIHKPYETTLEYYQSDAYMIYTFEDSLTIANKYGYLLHHTVDLISLPKRYNETNAETTIQTYYDALPEYTPNDYTNLFNNYNLIHITAESLDTRFIDENLTPTLYKIYHENSIVFDNYYAPVYFQGATCNSEFMALTSLYPMHSNSLGNNVCALYYHQNFPGALPHQFNALNYNTYYFHSGISTFYHRDVLMPNLGFDTIAFQDDLDVSEYNERRDSEMMTFINTLFNNDEPFYLNLLTYGMHGAYNQQDYEDYQPILDHYYPNGFDKEVENYYKKLMDFDALLKQLIEYLDANHLYDNTVLTIHTDHYPYMMDDKSLEKTLNQSISNYNFTKQKYIIHNPLLETTTKNIPMTTRDVAPTLLNLFTDDPLPSFYLGKDVLGLNHHIVLLDDFTITNGNYYLTRRGETNITDSEMLETFKNTQLRLMNEYELSKRLLYFDGLKALLD